MKPNKPNQLRRQIAFIGLLALLSPIFSQSVLAQPVGDETRGEHLAELVVTDEASGGSTDASTSASTNFDLLMIESGTTSWTAIRLDTQSGKSWIVTTGNVWKRIQEPEGPELAPSKYLVKATRFASSKYALIRMDSESGKTWFMKNDRWLPMPVFAQ